MSACTRSIIFCRCAVIGLGCRGGLVVATLGRVVCRQMQPVHVSSCRAPGGGVGNDPYREDCSQFRVAEVNDSVKIGASQRGGWLLLDDVTSYTIVAWQGTHSCEMVCQRNAAY